MARGTVNRGAAMALLLHREARKDYKAVCGTGHHFTGISQARRFSIHLSNHRSYFKHFKSPSVPKREPYHSLLK